MSFFWRLYTLQGSTIEKHFSILEICDENSIQSFEEDYLLEINGNSSKLLNTFQLIKIPKEGVAREVLREIP